ncbi:hypothetical protein TNCV_332241 [Trichonephila clavipes]|nr:hypothetical protein TNCV_332241 [Trichonephila clavipes]
MAEAAKAKQNPPDQPKRPPPAHTEESSSSPQLKDQPSPKIASPQTREPSLSTREMSSSLPKDQRTIQISEELRFPPLLLSAEPTTIPKRANHKPATIDFGISCGLDDVLVETQVELSSDHNPVQFILPTISDKPHAQNCTTFTNWNLFQDLLTTSIPGNPTINNSDEIEERISQFTNSIHLAINQSSKFKVFTHNITFIPLHVREKLRRKID